MRWPVSLADRSWPPGSRQPRARWWASVTTRRCSPPPTGASWPAPISWSKTGTSAATGTVEHIASHALFLDIVDGERIVSAHEALLDGVRRWVSLISIEFAPAPGGTRVTHTEQHTFLAWAGDGAHDQAHLRGSTQLAFNALAALVER